MGFLWLIVGHGAPNACSIYHLLQLNQQGHNMYRSISVEKFNMSPPKWLCATVSLMGREGYYTGLKPARRQVTCASKWQCFTRRSTAGDGVIVVFKKKTI